MNKLNWIAISTTLLASLAANANGKQDNLANLESSSIKNEVSSEQLGILIKRLKLEDSPGFVGNPCVAKRAQR